MPVLDAVLQTGLELVFKSTVLLAAASVVALFLKRKSAALRHLVWSAAFAGLLALPLLSGRLPAWRVVRPSPITNLVFQANAAARPVAEVSHQHLAISQLAVVNWPMLLTLILMIIWAVGLSIGLGQMVLGWLTLERLRRRAKVFAAPENGVELLEGDAGTMPMTYGLVRPVIFLPADARAWSPQRLRIVLRHELAHVKRGDCATHLLARFALSLFWWNPLSWWAWRQFLKEQELATDDLVLSAGACGSDYAGHLLAIARLMQSPVAEASVMAMANRSQLEGRLKAILDSRRDRRVPERGSILAVVIAAVGLVLPLAAIQARQADSAGKPQATGLLAVADAARDKGRFDDARAAYAKFLSSKSSGPDVATAYIHLGTVELTTKDYSTALSDFAMAQAADLGSVSEALMWQGITQERMKQPDEAARFYGAAVAAGEPHSIQTALVMELQSRTLESQGKKDDALLVRKKALDIRQSQHPSAAKSEVTGMVYRAGGDVQMPRLLTKVEPEYSMEARAALYSGVAILHVVIAPDGKPHDIQLVQPLGLGLDQKAMDAVSKWTFVPGTKDGKPVPVQATIEVNFRLL